MMCDIKKGRIEVLMHDVRKQLVDVFRWVCPRGREFREGGATQGSVFFRSQDFGGFLLQMDVQGFNCFPS